MQWDRDVVILGPGDGQIIAGTGVQGSSMNKFNVPSMFRAVRSNLKRHRRIKYIKTSVKGIHKRKAARYLNSDRSLDKLAFLIARTSLH